MTNKYQKTEMNALRKDQDGFCVRMGPRRLIVNFAFERESAVPTTVVDRGDSSLIPSTTCFPSVEIEIAREKSKASESVALHHHCINRSCIVSTSIAQGLLVHRYPSLTKKWGAKTRSGLVNNS